MGSCGSNGSCREQGDVWIAGAGVSSPGVVSPIRGLNHGELQVTGGTGVSVPVVPPIGDGNAWGQVKADCPKCEARVDVKDKKSNAYVIEEPPSIKVSPPGYKIPTKKGDKPTTVTFNTLTGAKIVDFTTTVVDLEQGTCDAFCKVGPFPCEPCGPEKEVCNAEVKIRWSFGPAGLFKYGLKFYRYTDYFDCYEKWIRWNETESKEYRRGSVIKLKVKECGSMESCRFHLYTLTKDYKMDKWIGGFHAGVRCAWCCEPPDFVSAHVMPSEHHGVVFSRSQATE